MEWKAGWKRRGSRRGMFASFALGDKYARGVCPFVRMSVVSLCPFVSKMEFDTQWMRSSFVKSFDISQNAVS